MDIENTELAWSLFEWTALGKHSYMKNDSMLASWDEAKAYCADHNASLLDFSVSDDVLYVNQTKSPHPFWIGLSRNQSGLIEIPRSMSDILVVGMLCMARRRSTSIVTKPCIKLLASICVKHKTEGKCDGGWNVYGEHCFLTVRDQMTWFGAYAHCKRLHSDLFTNGVHENEIASQMDGQNIWTGEAASTKLNPDLKWKWSVGSELQWTSQKINVPDLSCDGCGFLRNETVYLTSFCSKNHSYMCRSEVMSLSVTQSELNQRHVTWNKAQSNCRRELFQLNSQPERYLQKLAANNVTRPQQSYWLGLTREVNGNENNCTVTSVGNETHVTDYRLNKCLVASCSDFTRTRYAHCSKMHRPTCIKNAETVEDEDEGEGEAQDSLCRDWSEVQVDQKSMCLKRFENLHMTWLAAYLFCREQGGDLVSSSILSQMPWREIPPISDGCWLDDRKTYAHSDPLEGWKWLDGSQYNVTRRWGIDGGLVGAGVQRQCATIGLQSGIWNGSTCTIPHHFVCRKKLPEIPSENRQTREEALTVTQSLDHLLSCQNDNCTKDEKRTNSSKTQNVEELLSQFPMEIVQIVNKTSLPSLNIVTKNIELVVHTRAVKNLGQLTSNITSTPTKSIQRMCQNIQSCFVKSITMKMRNVQVNCSKWLEESPLHSADVISLDYLVNGQLLTELAEDETVSLSFSQNNKTRNGWILCIFLDGTEWSDQGVKVGSTDKESVKCISNHLSSFAMIALDSESRGTNKIALRFISYIGSGLSLVALLFTCVVYVLLYKDLQILTTSRHLVHFNLQIALGLTQIVFLAGGTASHKEVACKIVAILLHYFSLASFCWILLEAAMLYLKLISVYGGEFVKMRNFFAFGWGFPLLFVGLSSGLKFDAYGSDRWCWLSYDEGFFWAFFAPVIVVISVTIITLVFVARVLVLAAKTESSNKKYIVSAARGVIILFPTLGLSWTFSVIAVNHDAVIWKYLFVIATSTQGFFIFLIYGICNREIRTAVSRRLGREVFPTTSTT